MSARKSLPRRVSQLSRFSIQSQMSAVLDPDSNLISEDEGNPLWFKEFENNSVNVRPSARFSLRQNDTPVLDSDSEPDTVPLDKSWWKRLENTPTVQLRKSRSNVSKDKSNVTDRSNLESSDTSSVDQVATRQRIALHRNKRKSLQRNVFSEILDSEKPSTSFEKIIQHSSRNQNNQDTPDISLSDTDVSLEKVRKLPLKKRKKSKIVKKSLNTSAKSNTSGPDIFRQVLDASQSSDKSRRQSMGEKQPGILPRNQEAELPGSQDSAEGVILEREEPAPQEKSQSHRNSANESRDTLLSDDDLEGSRSPVLGFRRKKRTIFTKTVKRTDNFDELLNNLTEHEEVADESMNAEELESNQIEKRDEPVAKPSRRLDLQSDISDEVEDSDSEESIKKQRIPFPRRKQNENPQEKIFPQILGSLNTSVHSIPSTSQNKSAKLETSRRDKPLSDIGKQSSKRKSNLPEISRTLDLQSEEDQSAKKLSHLSRSTNKSQPQRRSANEIIEPMETPRRSNVPVHENQSENIPNRSSGRGHQFDTDRRSINKENHLQGSSGTSDIDLEEDASLGKPIHQSTMRNKSGAKRHSVNRKTYRVEHSVPLVDEVEENQPANLQIRPSSSSNESLIERRFVNERQDSKETSRSSSVGGEEDEIVDTRIRPSVSLKKSGDPNDTKSVSNQMQPHNKPHRISNKSINKELQMKSIAEKEDTEDEESFETAESPPDKIPHRSTDKSKSENASGANNTKTTDIRIQKSVNFKQLRDLNQQKSLSSQPQVQNNSRRISDKYIIDELGRDSTDEEEADGEEEEDLGTAENLPNESQHRSKARSLHQDATRVDQIKNAGQRRTGSRSESRSKVVLDSESEVYCDTAFNPEEGIENTESGEIRSTDVGTLAHSVRNGSEPSFSFADNERARSVQRSDTTLRDGSTQGTNIEKLTQIKNALAVIKKKELARMKNSKIDSYFKKIPAAGSKNVVQDSERVPNKRKPIINRSKTPAAISPNKAYLVNGKVYQRPKLPRPKSWATDRLYNYLWKKMEPKYKLRTRLRSEKFILYMSQVVALVVRRKKFDNYKDEMNNLIREMARLNIIKTRNDFNIFCQKFLPYDFRIKVIPMLLPGSVRNIPFEPHKMNTPILEL